MTRDALTFCVHARDRLAQLAATLPENLDAVARHPSVGLVLVNYNSSDDMHEWVRANLRPAIAAGTLLYARDRSAPRFHASKSKNLAHRLAPGRLLANLDCDNFIGDTIPFLLETAREDPNILIHLWSGTHRDGTYGRIAVARDLFHRLGGYDEALLPMGYQDSDLIRRASRAGARLVAIATGGAFPPGSPFHLRALPNQKPHGFRLMNLWNRARSRIGLATRGFRVNPDGWGRARLEVNFERELDLR